MYKYVLRQSAREDESPGISILNLFSLSILVIRGPVRFMIHQEGGVLIGNAEVRKVRLNREEGFESMDSMVGRERERGRID